MGAVSGLTRAGAKLALDHLLGLATYPLPGGLALGLLGAPPSASSQVELTTGQWASYARVALLGTSWGGAAGGASAYGQGLDFGSMAGGSGGAAWGWAIFDGATATWWGAFAAPVALGPGVRLSFAAGGLVCRVLPNAGAGGFSAAWAGRIVDHMTGHAALTPLASLPLALTSALTTDPNALASEVAYGGYPAAGQARPTVPVANLSATVLGTGQAAVGTQVNLPACTGGSASVAGLALCDTANVGGRSYVAAGPVVPAVAVSSPLVPELPAGQVLLGLP